MSAQSSIRIIGGKWRSRKVNFTGKDGLRPTPDRVRETLFNWLAPYIVDTICLDLCAGSGILGLEAISRGAKRVYAIENDEESVKNIKENKERLEAINLTIMHKNVITWLQTAPIPADIVFVDPPYKLNLLNQIFGLLEDNLWVHANSFIYFEQDKPFEVNTLPKNWQLWRESKAGNVYYYLARKEQ